MTINRTPCPPEAKLDGFLIVTVWYNPSESYYAFGPFTEQEAEVFIEALPDDEYESYNRIYINDPLLHGTGLELS